MLGRLVGLPHFQYGYWWYISKLSGSLIKSTEQPLLQKNSNKSGKLKRALACCDHPFDCGWAKDGQVIALDESDTKSLERMNNRFFVLNNKRFLGSIIYSYFGRRIFENTSEAFSTISNLSGHINHRADRCLQRSLLAAKTSKSFPDGGVLFIGAELDSGEMHAWIIEDGIQPDSEDRSWINYRPLLALLY